MLPSPLKLLLIKKNNKIEFKMIFKNKDKAKAQQKELRNKKLKLKI